jgi:hypothetical protein
MRLPWAPDLDDLVSAILPVGNKVYIGGSFTTVKGITRNHLASVNKTIGTPDMWNPNPDDIVFTFTANTTTLYVGGRFTTISNQPRQSVAAYTIANNSLTTFDPELKNERLTSPSLLSLAVYGNTLFMASEGPFYSNIDSIKGKARHILGAADTSTGEATDFNPHPDNPVNYLTIYGNRLLVGGQYNSLSISASSSYFNVFNLAPLAEPVRYTNNHSDRTSDNSKSSITNLKALNTFDVAISPNPVNNNAILNIIGNVSDISITLMDISGKVLWKSISRNEQSMHLPVEKLAPGMYLLKVDSRSQSKVIRFLKE